MNNAIKLRSDILTACCGYELPDLPHLASLPFAVVCLIVWFLVLSYREEQCQCQTISFSLPQKGLCLGLCLGLSARHHFGREK
jgi:hypothetical protein